MLLFMLYVEMNSHTVLSLSILLSFALAAVSGQPFCSRVELFLEFV